MVLPSRSIAAIDELGALDQWVGWRIEKRAGKKEAKVPVNPKTGNRAAVDRPATWSDFDTAAGYAESHDEAEGIGFVFTAEDPYVGIDLDKCVDAEGNIASWARWVLAKLDSYTEFSPSRRGVHCIVKGNIGGRRRRRKQTEIYSDGRYFTVTGNHLQGAPEDICQYDGDLAALLEFDPTDRHIEELPIDQTDLKELIAELEPHVDPDADIPTAAMEAPFTNAQVVQKTWEHQRKDLSDTSASGYDLALANYFLDARWSHVEIMHGLIAHRRKHGADLKIDRNPRCDYYARTILAAHRRSEREKAAESIRGEDLEGLAPEDRRRLTLDALTAIMGVGLVRIVKYGGDPPSFAIKTVQGNVVGDVDLILSQRQFRKAMAETTGFVIERMRDAQWDQIAQRMLEVVEEEDAGVEAYEAGQILSWLRAYLRTLDARLEYDPDAVMEGNPFRVDDDVYVVGSAFNMWLMRQFSVKLGSKKLGVMMREAGCWPKTWALKLKDGRTTSRSVWRLPAEFVEKEVDGK